MRVTITVTAAQLTPYLGRGRKTGGALVRELDLYRDWEQTYPRDAVEIDD